MESKPWYQSLTVWAGKAIILLQAIPLVIAWADASFGLNLQSNPVVINILSAIAGIIAIYGRFTAKTVIK